MDLCYGEHAKKKSFGNSNAFFTYDGSHDLCKDGGERSVHKHATS